jgi:DNA-binding NarL/FixJ family response regulator
MVHDGNAVLDTLATDRFDIVLLDLSMSAGGGINLVRKIRFRIVNLPILVVTIYDGTEIAQAVIEAGANGFISKASDPEQLLHAIREVARGKPFMELRLLKEIAFAAAPDLLKTLSPREKRF